MILTGLRFSTFFLLFERQFKDDLVNLEEMGHFELFEKGADELASIIVDTFIKKGHEIVVEVESIFELDQ